MFVLAQHRLWGCACGSPAAFGSQPSPLLSNSRLHASLTPPSQPSNSTLMLAQFRPWGCARRSPAFCGCHPCSPTADCMLSFPHLLYSFPAQQQYVHTGLAQAVGLRLGQPCFLRLSPLPSDSPSARCSCKKPLLLPWCCARSDCRCRSWSLSWALACSSLSLLTCGVEAR